MEVIKRIFILLLVLSLPSCTLLGTYMNPLNPAPTYQVNGRTVKINFVQLSPTYVLQHNSVPTYRVGPYDILNIIVWDHPELTTVTTQLATPQQSGTLVSDRGMISFPFAGTFKVQGLSLPQIERLIETKISKYIRDPHVTVRVATFRSKEAQVMGEVGAQRAIPLTDRPISVFDALNLTGGTSVITADTSHIYIIRGTLDHLTVFAINAKSPEMMMVAQRFYLKNNDIIYVSPLMITNWNRIISQLLPSFSAAQTAQAATDLVK
ncbi:MAG: polysaccharide biosynthesis/export family protein [Gammaproteobacteria bacterium]|nr:polysaccharide biosynthesis/export family protein [Gammaproteobacteria bacterium]